MAGQAAGVEVHVRQGFELQPHPLGGVAGAPLKEGLQARLDRLGGRRVRQADVGVVVGGVPRIEVLGGVGQHRLVEQRHHVDLQVCVLRKVFQHRRHAIVAQHAIGG
jgi:hypothetical protein